MSILKKINKFCGIISLLSLAIMAADLIITRCNPIDLIFYYSCGVFVIFGAIFMLTAAVFVLYNFILSIRRKQIRLFIRHYLYAFAAFYIVTVIIDYVVQGHVYPLSYFLPSLALAVTEIYAEGYKKSGQSQNVD